MPGKDPFPDQINTPTGPSGTSGQYRDLCSTCDHAEEHARRGRPQRPIMFCEEFEVMGVVRPPEPDRARLELPNQKRNVSGRIGLCVNCEFVATCTLPMLEGGVWHCEEYR